MNLPFQQVKTFTTSLSKDEVIAFVRERLTKTNKLLFFSTAEYVGSVDAWSFTFYKNFNSQYGRANPRISGRILSENPTKIEIKVSPHYFRVLFFSIFPLFFIPIAIFIDQMTINGVLREPELFERFMFGMFGGVGPMVWCYFDSIRPIKETELWIMEKLQLELLQSTLKR